MYYFCYVYCLVWIFNIEFKFKSTCLTINITILVSLFHPFLNGEILHDMTHGDSQKAWNKKLILSRISGQHGKGVMSFGWIHQHVNLSRLYNHRLLHVYDIVRSVDNRCIHKCTYHWMCINDDRLGTDHSSEARTLTSDFMLLNIQFYVWYFVYHFCCWYFCPFPFCSLYCLSFSNLRLLIVCIPLISSNIS